MFKNEIMASEVKRSLTEAKESENIFPSTSTEKRAIWKARCSLPRTPNKRAKIVEKLIQSPSIKNILERKGAVLSERTCKTLQMGNALLESFGESLKELKPKIGNMKKNKQYAYSGIRSVINNVKNRRIQQEIYKNFKLRRPDSLKKETENTWWSKSRKPRKDKISEHVKEKVKNFYLSSGISRENPNEKAALRIKKNKKVTILPRHNMLMSLEEAHRVFVTTNPEVKIGFTSFRKLRPLQVTAQA